MHPGMGRARWGRDPMGPVTGAGAVVLATSPEELRRAARVLRTVSDGLEGLGDRVQQADLTGDAWTGLAALEHRARTGALRRLVTLTAAPGLEVAGALERCAEVAEDAGARARAGLRRLEQGMAELRSLRTLGPPPEPLLEQAWRRRVAEVEQEVEQARRAVARAEEVFDLAQREAAGVLGRAWSVVEEAPAVRELAADLRRAVTGLPRHVAHVVRTTDMVVSLARARWAAEAPARALALQRATLRLQELWLQLRAPGEARRRFGRTRLVPGPVGWVSAWLAAWSDVQDGGGYEGWRGGLTRVLARGALVGGPVALMGLHPALAPAAPVGLGLISAYQAWTLGNVVWDSVPTVVRYTRLAVRHAPVVLEAVGAAAVRARNRATARLRELRAAGSRRAAEVGLAGSRRVAEVGLAGSRRVAEVGARVRDVTHEVTWRLPGAGPLRDRIRQVGVPIRLPAVPLGPVLRVPVDLGRSSWAGTHR
ncbi:hypothetical protein [Ornithinimicrobium flavum]|uniref:hypothetical protein n=1 Tax=Ornithinimicrobium flavum TaxID=1288636 RepID=UPI00130545F1|nr:hypothetical protein [Ornithinimicrobium flavum]